MPTIQELGLIQDDIVCGSDTKNPFFGGRSMRHVDADTVATNNGETSCAKQYGCGEVLDIKGWCVSLTLSQARADKRRAKEGYVDDRVFIFAN